MKRCIAAVIVSIVALSIPVAQAEDRAAGVEKMLKRLAGRWTWTGQQVNIGAGNSPYGQAGRFVGSGEGRLIMDGQFILDEYQEKSPEGNMLSGVSLISYDPVKKCFVARDCMSDGSTSVAEFTIEGRVRKDNITITSKTGEALLARVVGEYSRDWKRLEVTWEGSTDSGKTWQHWCSAVIEKTSEADSDKRELVQLQDEWCRAEMEGDAAALGRLLADEYVLVISNGTTLPRAQLLREVESREVPFTATAVEDTRVKLYGNMAVVKGVVKWSVAGGTKHQALFTETWQRRDGRWQCLATHESGDREIVAVETTPGYQKMKRLLGDWTYEGHVDSQWEGTTFGPAGKLSGQFQARFVLNGNFVEEHWEETYEAGGGLGGINIYRYDADTGNILSKGFQSDGTQDNTVYTIDGDTLTGDFKQTGADGKESLIKAVWKYGPNHDTFTSTWKLSLDEGKTWKRWLTYDAKKKK
jgi:hypothetical protein